MLVWIKQISRSACPNLQVKVRWNVEMWHDCPDCSHFEKHWNTLDMYLIKYKVQHVKKTWVRFWKQNYILLCLNCHTVKMQYLHTDKNTNKNVICITLTCSVNKTQCLYCYLGYKCFLFKQWWPFWIMLTLKKL